MKTSSLELSQELDGGEARYLDNEGVNEIQALSGSA